MFKTFIPFLLFQRNDKIQRTCKKIDSFLLLFLSSHSISIENAFRLCFLFVFSMADWGEEEEKLLCIANSLKSAERARVIRIFGVGSFCGVRNVYLSR